MATTRSSSSFPSALAGDTSLQGSAISGSNRKDTLVGGDGSDTLEGRGGDDLLYGGGGADIFLYRERLWGADTIADFGFGGVDRIDLSFLDVGNFASLQPFLSQQGSDAVLRLRYAGGVETVVIRNVVAAELGESHFVFSTSVQPLQVHGTSGVDDLFGAGGDDTITGSGGNDRLVAGAGDDLLEDASGDDLLVGGAGADTYRFAVRGWGHDTVGALASADRIDLASLNVADLATLQRFIRQAGADAVITTGAAESITIRNVQAAELTAANFIFRTDTAALAVSGTQDAEAVFGGAGNDTLDAGGGSDTVIAGAGDDTLIGGSYWNDSYVGGPGSDRFVFVEGFDHDTVEDFASGDRIDLSGRHVTSLELLRPFLAQSAEGARIQLAWGGRTESITLRGVEVDDLSADDFVFDSEAASVTVGGWTGADVLFGRTGGDRFMLAGPDTAVGSGGDDVFVLAPFSRPLGDARVLDFGAGDRVDVSGLNVGDFETLRPFLSEVAGSAVLTLGHGGDAETLTLQGVALADLAADAFVFRTSTAGITQTAPRGSVFFGGNGGDQLYGTPGRETLVGGAGDDWLDGGGNDDVLVGGAGDDRLGGGTGADRFAWSARLWGDDAVTDFAAGDRLDLSALGVGSLETVLALAAQSGVDTVLSFGLGGTAETVVLQNVALASLTADRFIFGGATASLALEGSVEADVLLGGAAGDSLRGDLGSDRLFGGAGADTLVGNSDGDGLWGGNGDDVLNGGSGTDTAIGGGGNDTLTGEAMDGGLGQDTYNVVLATDAIADAGGTDTVRTALASYVLAEGLENLNGTAASGVQVLGGNQAANRLSASDAGGQLSGRLGDDRLDGGAAADTLVGGDGADRLTGGGGADVFLYAAVGQSMAAARDTVRDFSTVQGDRIDLAGIDAVKGGADDAFVLRGTVAFTGTAGELVIRTTATKTFVLGDTNGDAVADVEILLAGAHALQAGDFLL